MAYLLNRIVYDTGGSDYYGFDDFLGATQPIAEQLEVIARPGRDGETLRTTGVRAAPTQLTSVRYVVDRDAAKAAMIAYRNLIGTLVEVIQHSESWGNFRVLAVQQQPLQAIVNVIGSLQFAEHGTYPFIKHRVQWTLLATELTA